MYKTPIKTRFIVASPESSINPLTKAITSIFQLFYEQIGSCDDKCILFIKQQTCNRNRK